MAILLPLSWAVQRSRRVRLSLANSWISYSFLAYLHPNWPGLPVTYWGVSACSSGPLVHCPWIFTVSLAQLTLTPLSVLVGMRAYWRPRSVCMVSLVPMWSLSFMQSWTLQLLSWRVLGQYTGLPVNCCGSSGCGLTLLGAHVGSHCPGLLDHCCPGLGHAPGHSSLS